MDCFNCFEKMYGETTTCDTCSNPLHKECAIKDGGIFCDVCYTVKASEPEKIEFEIPESIRRSYIETYRQCAYKFYKQIIEGYEAPPTIYTQLGIDLHEQFEYAIDYDGHYNKEEMLNEIKKLFDAYPDELFTEIAGKERMWKRATESIETFYTILPSIEKVFATEEKIVFPIGDDLPTANITMDLITERKDGSLDMHDWKTGGVMVGKKLSTDLQAPLYINAVRHKYNRKVNSFTFYYLEENKVRVFTRVDDDNYVCTVGKREYKINITDAIREVQHIFSQIKNGNFNIPRDTKSMYFACKMCHLPSIGQCEGAYEQSWKQFNF